MKQRDLSIDFMKGLAIILVIFEHATPYALQVQKYLPIWAVPIFLTITLYLSFGKLSRTNNCIEEWFTRKRFKAIWKRIVLPCLIVLIVGISIYLLQGGKLLKVMKAGGYGPGCYFLWVYLQMWVLIPFLYIILNKYHNRGIIAIFLICILLNVICTLCQMPDYIWRLSCIRYISLATIAYMWLRKDQYNKYVMLILGLLSYIYLVFFRNEDWGPWIYNSHGWSAQNYPCFFFTLIFILLIIFLWKKICNTRLVTLIYWFGENSWYLFLAQMFILPVFKKYYITNLTGFSGASLYITYFVLCFVASILSVCLFNYIRAKVSSQN